MRPLRESGSEQSEIELFLGFKKRREAIRIQGWAEVVVCMEKDMQVGIIAVALLIQKNVTVQL